MVKIEYNQPISVNRHKYEEIRSLMSGLVATRTTGLWFWRRYYVKLWFMKYAWYLEKLLNGKFS